MRTSRTRSWRAFDPTVIRADGAAPRDRVAVVELTLPRVRREPQTFRILGLDPGSRHTGFGIVECRGSEAHYIASGAISTTEAHFARRLQQIFHRVGELVTEYRPAEIAIERVFVNKNVDSAMKLGQARGAALCGVFAAAAEVFEYSPREVKMAVVGSGGADKKQVQHMVRALLRVQGKLTADAADALAVALCHVHGRRLRQLTVGGP